MFYYSACIEIYHLVLDQHIKKITHLVVTHFDLNGPEAIKSKTTK